MSSCISATPISATAIPTSTRPSSTSPSPPAAIRDSRAAERAILAALGGVPGVRFWANTFLTERIHEVLSGTTAPIVVHLFGRRSRHARRAMRGGSPRSAAPARRARPWRSPRRRPPRRSRSGCAAMRSSATGSSAKAVLDAIEAGTDRARCRPGLRRRYVLADYRVAPAAGRPDPATVGELPLLDGTSRIVPLGALATVREFDGRSLILHENAQPVQNVTVQIAHGGAGAFLRRAKKALGALTLSPGTYLAFGGTAEASSTARAHPAVVGARCLCRGPRPLDGGARPGAGRRIAGAQSALRAVGRHRRAVDRRPAIVARRCGRARHRVRDHLAQRADAAVALPAPVDRRGARLVAAHGRAGSGRARRADPADRGE